MRLKLYPALIGTVLTMCFALAAKGQENASNFTPLTFSENKGQWENTTRYRTDLGGSVITLKKNSFSFLLINKEDQIKIANATHGHPHPVNGGGPHIEHGKASAAPTPPANNIAPSPVTNPPRETPKARGHVYNVTFLNAADNPQISADKAQEGYANYFIGNDPSKWASEVRSYQRVNYSGLYPGIDMQVYSEASQLKYDLIVQPGADPAVVKLQYDGVTGIEIKKGQLHISTSVGDVIEQTPYAYQYINNQRVSVKVNYLLKNNQVSFRIAGNYDNKYPLIIDPTYIFSTLTGAKADNWGFTATYDDQGNFYGGGIIRGAEGYPTTPGAIQNVYGGKVDIGITKFSPNGRTAIYSTYIGGSDAEQPHSLFVDATGSLVISGRTLSGDFPFKTEEGKAGGWDIAVVKLNPAGTAITGAIRIAGAADDGVNMTEDRENGPAVLLRNYGDDARSEVVLDGAGNIYIASCTRSTDFPVTANAYQKASGGSQDAVVMKIDPSCSTLLWATYLGGSNEDAAYVLALNNDNTLYVAGGTGSGNFPTTAGAIYPAFRGGICDGFITHLTADGSRVLNSTFLGSDNPAADQVYGIQQDKGFVYVMGTTEGSWPVKQAPGTATFYNNGAKQFISKLQGNLSAFVYSTTFGKAASQPSISPTAFLVDRCENVYVSGWGGTITSKWENSNSKTFGLPLKNPLQSTTDGSDFYFFVLQRDATDILFGSYFGGNGLAEHVDGGTSRFDRNGVIYQGICAWCSQPGGPRFRYPVTPGTFATSQPNFCNLGALKIAFNLDGVKAGIKTTDRKNNYCIPSTISFIDTTTTNAQTWEWTVINQTTPVVMTTKDPFTHTFNAIGDYRVRLVKKDPATCNGADTAYTDIRIREDRATLAFVNRRLEPCDALAYEFDNTGSTAPPNKPFRNKSFVLDFGDGTPPDSVGKGIFPHKYQNPGVYNVTMTMVDTNYCNAPETITLQLRVAANVVASFNAPDSACAPATVEFVNTSMGGVTFTWDFGDGTPTSSEVNPAHTYNTPGTYNIHLIAVDNNTCNKQDDTTRKIVISPPPTAEFDFTPQKPQENTPVNFINQSIGAISYVWEFGDGEMSTQTNPSHQYNKTGTYDVCLYATNQFGCVDTVCKQVSAIVVPLYDIPSAFSPNGDGVNDIFYVKGFAISRFNIKIFNRWGQMVYESNDAKAGWDGKFKGTVQSMDAYAYVVNIEFNDGTKVNRTGNLTLLR